MGDDGRDDPFERFELARQTLAHAQDVLVQAHRGADEARRRVERAREHLADARRRLSAGTASLEAARRDLARAEQGIGLQDELHERLKGVWATTDRLGFVTATVDDAMPGPYLSMQVALSGSWDGAFVIDCRRELAVDLGTDMVDRAQPVADGAVAARGGLSRHSVWQWPSPSMCPTVVDCASTKCHRSVMSALPTW